MVVRKKFTLALRAKSLRQETLTLEVPLKLAGIEKWLV